MKFRAWCEDAEGPSDGQQIDAQTDGEAAKKFFDMFADPFPDNNDGDKLNVRVARWSELGDDADKWPQGRLFTFRLRIQRSIELVS
jgi:hypothetical protein